jgi:hypothetical protein
MNDWFTRLVRWALKCRHQWRTTWVNGFYTPIEEQCWNCGMHRHIVLSAERLHETPEWEPGRHPKTTAQLKPNPVSN